MWNRRGFIMRGILWAGVLPVANWILKLMPSKNHSVGQLVKVGEGVKLLPKGQYRIYSMKFPEVASYDKFNSLRKEWMDGQQIRVTNESMLMSGDMVYQEERWDAAQHEVQWIYGFRDEQSQARWIELVKTKMNPERVKHYQGELFVSSHRIS